MNPTYFSAVHSLVGGGIVGPTNGNLQDYEFKDGQIPPTEEEIQAKLKELQAAEPMRQLRIKRTAILAESDWMANSDVTMSDAWKDYRQALRDLPANSPNVALDEQGNLINVTWPTKPE